MTIYIKLPVNAGKLLRRFQGTKEPNLGNQVQTLNEHDMILGNVALGWALQPGRLAWVHICTYKKILTKIKIRNLKSMN